MGYSILELVLRRLREAGFAAETAFPGQKFPQITDTVAAVHIEKVDRANMTVTMEVSIICPASMGGTACEVEALRATEILRSACAVCVQNGCSYDGVAQVYVVQVLATFTGVTEADDCVIWPGFYCYVDNMVLPFAVGFSVEHISGAQPEYEMGEPIPGRYSAGADRWELRTEELIPCGSPEMAAAEGEFVLKFVTDRKTEIYSGCRWTSVRREFTSQGLKRICQGVAWKREEA